MVHEANVKQAAAEKQLKEAQGKVGDDPTSAGACSHCGSPHFGMLVFTTTLLQCYYKYFFLSALFCRSEAASAVRSASDLS